MKKVLFSLFFSLLLLNNLYSLVLLKGRVSNLSENTITIYTKDLSTIKGNGKVIKKIKINTDGTFKDTINTNEGYYNFSTPKSFTDIYLKKDCNITIKYDDKDLLNTINFSGDLSDINNYLTKKKRTDRKNFYDNFYKTFALNETEFLKLLKSLKKDKENDLKKLKKEKNFYKHEKKNIYYNYLIMIKDYQRLHRNITGNHSFTVSPQFLAPLSKAPLDDIDAFDNISEYRMFLSDYIAGTLQEDDTKFDYLSKKIKSIKYSRIKDFIALALSNFIAPRNTNFDKINNLAISIATDENIKREIKENYQIFSLLKPGSPSPDFSYTDINGKNVSLSDLRGNYVYIDVWATWCGPCKGQIPFLKKLVKKFKDKPIKFVSISVDRKKNYIAWKDFVKNHDMTWYQLFADNSWDSDFIKKYHIESIPHFILLDKQGKIIESDALRPSNATLENELNNLLK